MKILLIGGHRFFGRAIIEAALERNHQLSAFNRGVTWPETLHEIELIRGDRNDDLSKLRGRTWDLVVDTSGYHPRTVAASARALAQRTQHYTFVSSISVYPWPIPSGATEDAEVDSLAESGDANGDEPETYGQRKALCEREVAAAYFGRSLMIRPGMIVGPHDETQRLAYWIERAARGGTMVAPGDPSRALQMIDVADLARFTLDLSEKHVSGAVNATGPLQRLTWGAFIGTCLRETRANGSAVWLDDEKLIGQGFGPGSEFPWWLPAASNGIFEMDLTRARTYGLQCRPLKNTVRRTWEWLRTLPEAKRPLLLDPRRELDLISSISHA